MNKKKMIYFVLFCFSLIVTPLGCGVKEPVYLESAVTEHTEYSGTEDIIMDTEEYEPTEQVSGGFCYVYVCGAVKNPGVYALPENSRVFEAVQMAGGLLEDASEDSVNQAESLFDGQMIRIPTKEEAEQEQTDADSGEQDASDTRVNINTASLSELMTLPGIGQSKAEAIIAYREAQGKFAAIDEIMKVEGIKAGVYNRIREQIKAD